tara:strand:- start:141 stop:1196 length:1056 start_codon:yes stop_codon:yes gene_type:complete
MAYTTIDDPSAHFHTQLYAGNGSTQSITNDGNSDLQPDLLWIKSRSDSSFNALTDSTRGTSKRIYSNSTAAEESHADRVTAFNSDGFSLGGSSLVNTNNYNYAAWQWKANGGSVTTVGESGSNPGFTRQTNTDAGFSIIAYTGTGSNGTIAHGLPSTPEMIIFKRRNADQVWATWHQGIGDDYKLVLNSTDAKDADGAFMNSTLPTSSNITVGGASVNTNADGGTYICYAFSPIQGYSKFGSYVGNGNSNGAFAYTGFKPAFVMIKRTDSTGGWTIYDTKRGYNGNNYELFPHSAEAEYTGTSYFEADILSNGFKLRLTDGQINAAGGTYIYMAFAENPFTTSTGIPTTAR